MRFLITFFGHMCVKIAFPLCCHTQQHSGCFLYGQWIEMQHG